MNRDRLLRLADLLEADAANPKGIKFDLGSWAEALDRDTFPHRRTKLDCNTQACAIGLACLSGVFKKEGLRWRSLADEEDNITPIYKESEGFDAVTDFFEITFNQALQLFDAGFYINYDLPAKGSESELLVAKRIRDLVAVTKGNG